MTLEEKSRFISNNLFFLLANLSENSTPAWGKMDARQMLEHLNDFFEVSTEKIVFPLSTPEEHLPKYREFLYSEKVFRENTKAPAAVLGEEPLAWRNQTLDEALSQLKGTVDDFFGYFKTSSDKKTLHPVFGVLNYDEWIMLHYKHVMHHLKQFNLV